MRYLVVASLRWDKEVLRMMVSETSPFLPIIVFASSPSGSFPPAQNTGHQQRVVLTNVCREELHKQLGN